MPAFFQSSIFCRHPSSLVYSYGLYRYAIGSYALIFSNISGAIGGQCSAKFQCLCASCLSIFNGEVNSSVPGKYCLVVDSPKLRCKVKKLKELRCNKNAGYERAWDDRKKQDYCRLSLSQVCKATKLMLGGRELQGSLSSPMLAKIGDTTTLEVQLAGLAVQAGHAAGRAPTVSIWSVGADVAQANVSAHGKATLDLSSTGQFEAWVRVGSSSCKVPSQLDVVCQDGYRQGGAACEKRRLTANLQIVLGISIGVVLALCVFLFLFLIHKHPDRAKEVLISFASAGCGLRTSHGTTLPNGAGNEALMALQAFAEVRFDLANVSCAHACDAASRCGTCSLRDRSRQPLNNRAAVAILNSRLHMHSELRPAIHVTVL